MLAQRLRQVVALPFLAVALAFPARASIADPPSGTPIDLLIGQSFKIKLKNAGGCTFDYAASALDPGIISITPDSGTDATKASISITGLAIGQTMLTIASMNGTCPPATHTYEVTVSGDIDSALKDFNAACKAELKTFKHDFKAGFSFYKSMNSDLAAQFKDATLDEDTLQDAFHAEAVMLRQSLQLAAALSYTDVIGLGTQLLSANGVTSQAPADFFAGGGGAFDTFQGGVCGQFASFHDQFDKAAGSAIKKFEKAGAPRYGQWNALPPLYASGPLYPQEVADYVAPQFLAGPLTFTVRPTTNVARDNGRLLVSGIADSSLLPPFHVSLTHAEEGQAPIVFDFTPEVLDNEWSQTFPGLLGGTWTLSTGYEDDTAKVQFPVHITSTF